MLQVDPVQAHRLADIARNLTQRIEARTNGWLGEVEGLQVSLDAARSKIASLQRQAGGTRRTTDLGIPRGRDR
ncbi:hypothetical protein [Actinoplanes sp. NPDC051411]|uniref:hypothetical protein n=1 Tax=Actinoplanes sp. NPDC051411 TaxID=3155522 RepID=UPI0034459825